MCTKKKENYLHSIRRIVQTAISDQTNQGCSEWFLGHSKSPCYTKKEPDKREIYATKSSTLFHIRVDRKVLSMFSFRSLIPISKTLGFPSPRDMNTFRFTIELNILTCCR
jgi:hypothetical protein